MANIIGSQGNIQKIRTGYRKVLALGEGVASDEFRMTFEGYSDISYLVQSTQLPALAREPIESFGPNGVQFVQQGRYKNAQEVPISFKEVITGKIYEFLRALAHRIELLLEIAAQGKEILYRQTGPRRGILPHLKQQYFSCV